MQPKELQPKQYGLVYFDSDPHGANIFVDGQVLVDPDSGENLRTPAKSLLYEGRHDFTMTLEGHEDTSGYFDVFVGVTVNVYKRLKPGVSEEGWGKPQPQIYLNQQEQIQKIYEQMQQLNQQIQQIYQQTQQAQQQQTRQLNQQNKLYQPQQRQQTQQTGVLKAYSFPDGAEVYIDERPAMTPEGQIAKTPVTITNVPAGARQVTFKMPGHIDEMKLVDIEAGAWSEVSATMRPVIPKLEKKLENMEDGDTFGFLDIEDHNEFNML